MKILKHTICAVSVAMAILAMGNMAALAANSDGKAFAQMQENSHPKILKLRKVIIHKCRRSHAWRLGLNRDKKLSEHDARIITQAALLMHNRHDLKIASMQPMTNKRGIKLYRIKITDQRNKPVSLVLLNSRNGYIKPININFQKNTMK